MKMFYVGATLQRKKLMKSLISIYNIVELTLSQCTIQFSWQMVKEIKSYIKNNRCIYFRKLMCVIQKNNNKLVKHTYLGKKLHIHNRYIVFYNIIYFHKKYIVFVIVKNIIKIEHINRVLKYKKQPWFICPREQVRQYEAISKHNPKPCFC